MKTKNVEIAGKSVTLAYCYATEIIYNDLTNEDINDFFKEVFAPAEGKAQTNPKKLLYAILACAIAYSQGTTQTDGVLEDKTLMYEAKPSELIEAFKVVVELHNDWYTLPSTEKPEEEGKSEKNSQTPTTSIS